jgi:hypothetical protein
MINLLILLTTFTSTSAQTCVQYGHTVCGVDLNATCVHETSDFSVAYNVTDGVSESVSASTNTTALELYSGQRMTNQWEDCCPPDTFMEEIQCHVLQEQGECCYTEDTVFVWNLEEHIGCVHDVVEYQSHVPSFGTVEIPLESALENHEVELYGGQHDNGCCACYLHAVPCGPCQERL